MPNSTAVSAEEEEAVARSCSGERRKMPLRGSCIFLTVISRAEIDFSKADRGIGWFGAHQSWEGSSMEMRENRVLWGFGAWSGVIGVQQVPSFALCAALTMVLLSSGLDFVLLRSEHR